MVLCRSHAPTILLSRFVERTNLPAIFMNRSCERLIASTSPNLAFAAAVPVSRLLPERRRLMADLYGIPITWPAHPSRILMRSVTGNGASKSAAGCGFLTLSQDPTPSPLSYRLNRSSLGEFTCWTSSWWPPPSASSRCRSATPSPAIGSEEACHDLRLFTRRPRDRGADDLPRLRAAQARAALRGSRP